MPTTSERFSFPLTGSEEDRNNVASQLRRDAIQKLIPLEFLNKDQKEDVALVVGEAAANAIRHASSEGVVTCEVTRANNKLGIKIANPCDYFPSKKPSLPKALEESGRGRVLIIGLVKDLRQSGLKARSCYRSNPRQRKTVFSLSVRQ